MIEAVECLTKKENIFVKCYQTGPIPSCFFIKVHNHAAWSPSPCYCASLFLDHHAYLSKEAATKMWNVVMHMHINIAKVMIIVVQQCPLVNTQYIPRGHHGVNEVCLKLCIMAFDILVFPDQQNNYFCSKGR